MVAEILPSGRACAQPGAHARLRRPLLRGARRLHAPCRKEHAPARRAMGGVGRPRAAGGGRGAQQLHPQSHLRPGVQARRAVRVVPRQPQAPAGPVEAIIGRHPDVRSVSVYAVPDDPVGDRVMAAIRRWLLRLPRRPSAGGDKRRPHECLRPIPGMQMAERRAMTGMSRDLGRRKRKSESNPFIHYFPRALSTVNPVLSAGPWPPRGRPASHGSP